MKPSLFLVVVLFLLLTSCGSPQPATLTVVKGPLVNLLTFAGSTTIQPLAGALGEAFQELHPNVSLNIAAGGSRVGIQAVHDGAVDIGMVSRHLTPEEAKGVTVYTIALDVIAIIVHPNNPLENLELTTLTAIYRGEITNWSQIGGPDWEITVVTRETTSGTRGAFDELVLGGEQPALPNLLTAVTAGDMAAMIAARPTSIGYIGFGNISDTVKVLRINGVAPSQTTAQNGQYPLVRPLNLVTGPLSQPLANNFIEFVLSPEGQQIVEAVGWVPVR